MKNKQIRIVDLSKNLSDIYGVPKNINTFKINDIDYSVRTLEGSGQLIISYIYNNEEKEKIDSELEYFFDLEHAIFMHFVKNNINIHSRPSNFGEFFPTYNERIKLIKDEIFYAMKHN